MIEPEELKGKIGIQRVWGILEFASKIDAQKRQKIWGYGKVEDIIHRLTPDAMLEKFTLYNCDIKRNCVLVHEFNNIYGVVVRREGRVCEVITENGYFDEWDISHVALTERTVDVQKFLNQIGGKADEENTRED